MSKQLSVILKNKNVEKKKQELIEISISIIFLLTLKRIDKLYKIIFLDFSIYARLFELNSFSKKILIIYTFTIK